MSALAAFALALVPGLLTFWRGRPLLAAREDPALPERFFALRRQTGNVVAIGIAVLVVVTRGHAAWAVPLLLLVTAAGGFPLRRALFEETWGLGAYLAHFVRFSAATTGFWILLAFAPALVLAGGASWRYPAALMLAVLLAWSLAYHHVFVRLLGARPLAREDLDERLTAIEARARVTPPHRLVAGPAGGRWANAFALPSTKRGAVIFGRTLLERLEPDELGAVHAHELAHLEHFDPPRVWRGFAVMVSAAVLACLAVPWAARRAGDWGEIVPWAWPVIVLVGLLVYKGQHRGHEAESDARAVTLLGGDGEALIRALTRIHALSALPARWAADFERSATHPSLAARAQVIRAACGVAPAGLTEPLLVRGWKRGEHVVLETNRLHLLEGVPDTAADGVEAARGAAARVRTLPYAELTELRVHAGVTGPTRLALRERSGRSVGVPIRTEDVARLQHALDEVGAQIAPTGPESTVHPLVSSLLLLTVILASLPVGPAMAPLVAAALALGHTGAPSLAAVAVTAAGTALLAGPPGEIAPLGAGAWHAARWSLLGLGVVAAAVAVRAARRWSPPTLWTWTVLGGLAAFGTLMLGTWLSAALIEPASLRLHQAALARPGAALLPLGLAAALLAWPSRRLRLAAILPALLAMLPLAARSPRFAARHHDPLRAGGAAFTARDDLARPWQEARFDEWVQAARFSPSGTSYAWQTFATGDRPAPAFRFARFAGGDAPGRDLDALDLGFLDEARVLAVAPGGGGLELRVVEVATGAIGWRQALPLLSIPRVTVDAKGEGWRVTGLTLGEPAWAVHEGRIGSDDAQEARAPVDTPFRAWSVAQTPQAALAVKPTSVLDALRGRLAGVPGDLYGSELWDAGGPQPRRLLDSAFTVYCAAPPPGQPSPFLCVAYDGTVSHLWALEPPGWERKALGTVAARAQRPQVAEGWVAAMDSAAGCVVLDLEGRRFARLSAEPGFMFFDASLRGDLLGVLSLQGGRSVFRLYRLTR